MSRARDFADLGSSVDAGGLTGRNLFINGAMQVAQRGTSSTASGMNTVDRFEVTFSGMNQLAATQSQSTTVPSGQGFSNSLKVEVTTAENTLAITELFRIIQRIEAQNLQHLAFGSSSAKPLTLSFWVRSSLAGKYSVLFFRGDASPSRSNTPSYTINAADTWEYKTITIDGDTTGGVIDNDNGQGLNITWTLAAGSAYSGNPHTGWGNYSATQDFSHSDQVNFAAQTGTFYLTGVQLEVGETPTPFEHESHGTTLAKCLRFYNRLGLFFARVRQENVSSQNPDFVTTITFPPMRDAPTINTYTDANYSSSGTTTTGGSVLSFLNISKSSANASMNSASSGAQNVSNSAYLELDKEL